MVEDRELLERAARAAGLVGEIDDRANGPVLLVRHENDGHWWTTAWSPFADDGDALRLAVKLRLHLSFDLYGGETYAVATPSGTHQGYDAPCGDDPCAATRRAIVRAAAQLAKEPS